jgi:hypothetical protein
VSRPCFLVIDREFPGSLSTRKLVLETAKFNVITVYSGREGLETLRRFPAIDGIVTWRIYSLMNLCRASSRGRQKLP